MRDFERLEELSSTVHSGVEANGVIWAIDQALVDSELDADSRRSLESGRDILKALSHPAPSWPQAGVRRSQNMLGCESASRVRNMVVLAAKLDEGGEGANVVLGKIADALDSISKGEPAEPHRTELELALDVFTKISEVRLGQANGIVRARRERSQWLQQTTISLSP
jgi:hypothetical protein